MQTILELDHVTKYFGKRAVVDNVSLTLRAGEIYGFLGPNGAGKTTTTRMIMDFIRPSSGQILVFGQPTTYDAVRNLDRIGYLSADSTLYPKWSGEQHIRYVERVHGHATTARDYARTFELDLGVPYRKLSSGNKQKLGLILALMSAPQLLVLDEPTRGLDPLLQQEIYDILLHFKQQGGSVFMSSHNLSEVQKVCDHVAIIRGGKLVASETLESLRGLHVHRVQVEFAVPVTPASMQLANVELVQTTDTMVIAQVRGDLTPFIQAIASYPLRDLEVTHASLEEMFMRQYQ